MIDCVDILEETRDLAKAAHGREIRRRTTISRAYYAAYHRVETAARGLGYRFNNGAGVGMHADLIGFMRQSGRPELVGAAEVLYRLKGLRVLADYKLHASVSVPHMREAIEQAEYLLTELLPPPEPA